MTVTTPSVQALKEQARRLRHAMSDSGTAITHAEALEAIARQYGHRDWNTASAVARTVHPPRWQIGQRIRGRYLAQSFTGRIKSASESLGGYWRLTLVFDAPVDVVTSDKFSNLRRQVDCVINAQGVTAEKTSDGTPHMALFAA